MAEQWTRVDDALGVSDASRAVESGSAWAILWCGGGVSRSSDSRLDTDGLAYVRRNLIDPDHRERQARKAARKGRTKTFVMAERWRDSSGEPLIVFYESGPYLLPDRDEPTRLGGFRR